MKGQKSDLSNSPNTSKVTTPGIITNKLSENEGFAPARSRQAVPNITPSRAKSRLMPSRTQLTSPRSNKKPVVSKSESKPASKLMNKRSIALRQKAAGDLIKKAMTDEVRGSMSFTQLKETLIRMNYLPKIANE